jgi:hypothetical protein
VNGEALRASAVAVLQMLDLIRKQLESPTPGQLSVRELVLTSIDLLDGGLRS